MNTLTYRKLTNKKIENLQKELESLKKEIEMLKSIIIKDDIIIEAKNNDIVAEIN